MADNGDPIGSKGPNRQYVRWGQMKTERASWWAHWKEISDYLLPRSGRYFVQDRNRGYRRHNNIYDSTATRALRVLGAGLMSGATSPARPWFRYGISDPDLMKSEAVKLYCKQLTDLTLDIFAKSNTYRTLHQMYEELGGFGTAASVMMDDFDDVVCHHPSTVGEFCIATNHKAVVDTLGREFQMQVSQIVREFGYNNCSTTVRNLYDRNQMDAWVTVVHMIQPRDGYDLRKKDARNMPFESCYFELGRDKQDQYLRESGMKRFNVLAPRWAISGGDIYGNAPGMESLGDIKQLQHEQLRKAEGIDYQTKPPLILPLGMKDIDVNRLPGGISYGDTTGATGAVKTMFEVKLDLSNLLADIQDVRERIRSTFYVDMFLMISNEQSSSRETATEIAEKHEEKLLMLGPVLERLHNELYIPLIEYTFHRILEANIGPPAPPELHGKELQVEFISVLAQAQRAVSTNSVDRFVGNLGAIAQYKPGVLDKFDEDHWADSYSDMLGIDPALIVSGDKVALIRKQRADAQAQQQKMAAANSAADTAQKLGNAKTTPGTALGGIAQNPANFAPSNPATPQNPVSPFTGYQ